MRHKWMNIGLMTAGLVMGLALTAQATLIGDSVDFRFKIPKLSFDQSGSTTVTADNLDAVDLTQDSKVFTIDPFESGFEITFKNLTADGALLSIGSFFEFSGLQWQGCPARLLVSRSPTTGVILMPRQASQPIRPRSISVHLMSLITTD